MGSGAARIGGRLRNAVAMVVQATVLQIDANLRASPDQGGTPVDTGHARANWIPSLSAPHSGEVADDGAHDAGAASILSYVFGQGPAYVSNSVPYIRALNWGHSKQAASMFIERAIDAALHTVQQQVSVRFDLSGVIAKTREAIGARGLVNALHAMGRKARAT